jgi:hypothetical protein
MFLACGSEAAKRAERLEKKLATLMKYRDAKTCKTG